MLRITVHDNPDVLTFQVEGTLAEPFVQELESCWEATQRANPGRTARVDLTGVTYVDDLGKTLLTSLHAQGATFVCAGCLINAMVAEITNGSRSGKTISNS